MEYRIRIRTLGATLALATATLIAAPSAQPPERLPEFPEGVRWINSDALTVEGLRGKVVLLDVWTFG